MSLNCPSGGQQIAHVSVILDSTMSIPARTEMEAMANDLERLDQEFCILVNRAPQCNVSSGRPQSFKISYNRGR